MFCFGPDPKSETYMRKTTQHAKRIRQRRCRTRAGRLRKALRLLYLYQKLLQNFYAFSERKEPPPAND